MGREGGTGSGSSGFSNGLLRARRWKAPGGKVRVSGGDVRGFGGTPRSAGKTPGTTQSRWSSDDDEGVEVAPFGGDREGRTRRELVRARGMHGGTDHLDADKPCRCERRSPPPKEVAAVIAMRWSSRTGASRSRGSSDGVAAPLAWPLFERRADRPCEGRGTHRASRVDDTAEALFVTCSRLALKRSGRGEDARDRVAGLERKTNETRKVPRTVAKPETIHVARRTRSRPSGSTRGRSGDRGPTPVDASSAGEARRATRHQRHAGRTALEKNTLQHVGRIAEVSNAT
jgi:hypothetical protein